MKEVAKTIKKIGAACQKDLTLFTFVNELFNPILRLLNKQKFQSSQELLLAMIEVFAKD